MDHLVVSGPHTSGPYAGQSSIAQQMLCVLSQKYYHCTQPVVSKQYTVIWPVKTAQLVLQA